MLEPIMDMDTELAPIVLTHKKELIIVTVLVLTADG
jgi:hypothetical protein